MGAEAEGRADDGERFEGLSSPSDQRGSEEDESLSHRRQEDLPPEWPPPLALQKGPFLFHFFHFPPTSFQFCEFFLEKNGIFVLCLGEELSEENGSFRDEIEI